MSKICGLIDPSATKQAIEERLHSMAQVMKHHPNSPEEYLLFEGGGIALVGNPSFSLKEKRSATNEERGSLLGLCGRVVGLGSKKGGAPLPPSSSSSPREDGGVLPADDGGASALLGAFEEQGEDLLGELNGTFAFAHYDPKERTLCVANDRYGLMPLFYTQEEEEGGTFLFASEVKAILRGIRRPPELDWHSVADFFYVGHMMGQKTLFEGVQLLDSGQLITYREGTLGKRQYHDFTSTPLLSPEEVSTEKLASLFVEAVRRRVREDKPNTLLLSGGFDSRLILGAMHKLGVTPRIVTLEHGRQAGGMDGRFAALMAQRLGMECDFRRTRADFFASPDSIETFYIQDGMVPTWGLGGEGLFISEVYPELDGGMGAVWDGLGIDLVLAGGRRRDSKKGRVRLQKFAEKRSSNRLLLGLTLSPRWFLAANRGFMRRLRGELARIPESENRIRHFRLKHRIRRRIAVNPYQLSSAKVEPVTPGLDIDFMDYALGIPRSLTLGYKLYIEMLRKHFPVLTEVPVLSGSSLFRFEGDETRGEYAQASDPSRHLKGWSRRASKALGAIVGTPGRRTTRTEEHESARLVIRVLEQKHFDRPLYNKRLLRRLFSAYRAGNGAYHKLFALVFYIELWHLLFVDEDSPLLFEPRNVRLPDEAAQQVPST